MQHISALEGIKNQIEQSIQTVSIDANLAALRSRVVSSEITEIDRSTVANLIRCLQQVEGFQAPKDGDIASRVPDANRHRMTDGAALQAILDEVGELEFKKIEPQVWLKAAKSIQRRLSHDE